jgi:hypothetical protein
MNDQFQELRELIVGMREHIDGRLAHIDGRFNQIDEHIAQLHVYIDERFTQMREYTDERTRDMETRLLKGFQKWATSIELTIKPMPIRMGSIEERLSLLEERWKDIGNSGAQFLIA